MDKAPQKYFRAKLHWAETTMFSPANLSTFTVLAIGIPCSHNPIHYTVGFPIKIVLMLLSAVSVDFHTD